MVSLSERIKYRHNFKFSTSFFKNFSLLGTDASFQLGFILAKQQNNEYIFRLLAKDWTNPLSVFSFQHIVVS